MAQGANKPIVIVFDNETNQPLYLSWAALTFLVAEACTVAEAIVHTVGEGEFHPKILAEIDF